MQEFSARAAEIVAGLSTDACIALVSGRDFWTTRDVPGLVPSALLADGPHGLRTQAAGSDELGLTDSRPATCFPTASVLAATWDVDLVREVGEALGRESRAEGVALLLGPGLNLRRHPRGGRNFEYFSEDPVLAGLLGAAFVDGVHSQGVGACAKHVAANNQETGRMVVDTVVDERTLRELYLRPFELVVRRARPAAVMTAYNRLNGTYCSDHPWLLRDVLRGEWGFDGLVVSDWQGTDDRVAALRAGTDLEMPGNGGVYTPEIRRALRDGTLPERDLRASAARVVAFALGAEAVRARPAEPVDLDAHHDLARRVAAAGTVLLTNDGLLPLADTRGLALIGAFAVLPRYQGGGSSRVHPTRLDTLRAALGTQLPYAPGYDPLTGATSPGLLAEAVAVAAAAERVVLVVGVPPRDETETRDRPGDALPASMNGLVEQVCRANPRTVVVVMNGGAVELDWADRPAALLEAYLGGQAGGSALADVLLGRAEPTGRLAESLPVRVSDLPADANFPGLPRQVRYQEGPWIGYRFHDRFGVPARFPFGHGLGYTTWRLGEPEATGEGTSWTVSVSVTNTGDRPGRTVVQVYLGALAPTLPRPVKELAGFGCVELEPGASARVEVPLEPCVFGVWDTAAGRWVVEGGRYEVLVGTSSTQLHGRVTLDVGSPDVVTGVPCPAGPVATDEEFAALLGRPLPEPEGPRPFRRTSTLPELNGSLLGRGFARLVRWAMSRLIPPEDDGTLRDLLDGVIAGLPLRSIATSGKGMSLATLDRIVHLLNGRPLAALRGRPSPR